MAFVKAHIDRSRYKMSMNARSHQFIADEPAELNGSDLGPTPDELLCSALAACTSATLRMYADRKSWPLEEAVVTVKMSKGDDGKTTEFARTLHLIGELTDDQKARLLDVAGKCPVHRALTQPIRIDTSFTH
jgi:putative redox protein